MSENNRSFRDSFKCLSVCLAEARPKQSRENILKTHHLCGSGMISHQSDVWRSGRLGVWVSGIWHSIIDNDSHSGSGRRKSSISSWRSVQAANSPLREKNERRKTREEGGCINCWRDGYLGRGCNQHAAQRPPRRGLAGVSGHLRPSRHPWLVHSLQATL